MAQPLILTFAPQSAIAETQTGVLAGYMVLVADTVSMGPNILRTVSLTAAGDNAGTNFTITGLDLNGDPVSETIVGPNANTVSTTALFNSVQSIYADDAYVDVSAVTGIVGQCGWVMPRPSSVSWACTVEGNITYSLETTNSKVYIVGDDKTRIIRNPDCNAFETTVNDSNESELFYPQAPVNGIRFVVTAGDNTGGLTVEIVESYANIL